MDGFSFSFRPKEYFLGWIENWTVEIRHLVARQHAATHAAVNITRITT
jgi:hypothetical protein